MTDDLKPCPFCGGEARLIKRPGFEQWGTECKYCDTWRDDRCLTQQEARDIWNTRADLPPTDAQVMAHPKVRALVEALEALLHAACSDVGFVHCVRRDSGIPYQWLALDAAEKQTLAALAALDAAEKQALAALAAFGDKP